MGKEIILEGAYRIDSYYTLIHLPHWELGADRGFIEDGLDSMQVCFLVVVTACLEINKGHFYLLQYIRWLHICEIKKDQSCLKKIRKQLSARYTDFMPLVFRDFSSAFKYPASISDGILLSSSGK